jgi:hypothetical protein
MLVVVSLVQDEHSGTTLSEMWSMLASVENAEFGFEKEGPRHLTRQSLHDPQSGRHHLADLFPPALNT